MERQYLAAAFAIGGATLFSGFLWAQAPAPAAAPAPTPAKPAANVGPGGGLSPFADKLVEVTTPNPFRNYTAVTDAMLASPAQSEWLTWRRAFDYQGFSPLKQIDRGNVRNLRVAWSWTLSAGPNESTPLVHDGVLFAHSYGDKIQAIDAATGDLLWQYSRTLPQGVNPSVKRAIAIYRDKVYAGTSDAHMIALDARTGTVVWDQEIAAVQSGAAAKGGIRPGLTGGPLVAKGKVMIGTNGRMPGGCEIVAFDADTGKVAWRFHTIAQPGEPNGDSWNGLPVEKRNGGSVWVPGSYDAALGLAFFGIAQTYDTGPLRVPVNQPGVTNDGLYTDSTVALDPDTGKVAWHFQHLPNDQWDLDWVFERQLIKLPVNGQTRTLVVSAGKAAIYDALDAQTGKYAFSYDSGLQNFIKSVNPITGAKDIDISKVPGDGERKIVCPHAGGAKNWLPGSYNPNTKIVYTPLVESCMDLYPPGPGGRESLSTGVAWAVRPRANSDGKYGRLQAVNLETRKAVWVERHRAPESSGALDTAGGVVFSGSIDRFFRAYDDANGKLLWETRLNDVPSSAPIAYSVNGKQYLAVVVGFGGAQAATFPVLVPEIKVPPDRGSSIWVFALP